MHLRTCQSCAALCASCYSNRSGTVFLENTMLARNSIHTVCFYNKRFPWASTDIQSLPSSAQRLVYWFGKTLKMFSTLWTFSCRFATRIAGEEVWHWRETKKRPHFPCTLQQQRNACRVRGTETETGLRHLNETAFKFQHQYVAPFPSVTHHKTQPYSEA